MKDYNLLVVDDEPFVLNLSIRVLNNLGFERIATASNGKDALAMVTSAEEPYDIIICDLNMPEMDGVAFMRLVSETDYSGSLILLSGEEERMLETALELAKAHSLNVLGFIQKPIKPDLLNDLIAQHNPNSGDSNRFTPQDPITEEELRDGLAPNGRNDVILFYQPKVHVGTGTITGVEALARWQHPERGLLGPGSFIPLAEKTGLITQLTQRIFEKATHQTAEWMLYGINLKTSVNVSINSFSEPNFSDFLIETTEQAGLDPKQIVLEVTETQVMKNAVECMEIMMRLRLKKFGLSIDDFGTGNSSMSQLKNIPFTELKIDRAFVHDANHNHGAKAILEASVGMAKSMRMEIVAEGAENREDWDVAELLEVDHVQGYYCAKPMPNNELLDFMESWIGPHAA